MKILIIAIFNILPVSLSLGQEVMTFTDASRNGISIQKLDSIYKSGIHANPSKSVFSDTKVYMESYKSLLVQLGQFLRENEFFWEKDTRAFNRIYFKEDGTIEYFIYNFTPSKISDERERRFKELLSEFVKNHKFGLTADVKFAQCSPVMYKPMKED